MTIIVFVPIRFKNYLAQIFNDHTSIKCLMKKTHDFTLKLIGKWFKIIYITKKLKYALKCGK